ncbi:fluoride efflux transporter FluC [Bacillus pseudomycoides]|uniref:Fluoride-specific ion channel FluC n=1 Tax=Bacillus pseudomycoides TaxID=64104 RepID=A0A2B6K2F2_9BACI|nr:CrcB family protein [Bacillus pseudomycoides]PDY48972.1 fluoride efflux transporter CrcB [Bacillus pseudomycoides]PEA85318.1 fluoride efflux transporter CrcB [Bacillus pseudomycoides]PED70866.1 fluoride efflux transporter CrcB [Bacillus pseudomycoides]PEI40204.1 fluoride efflux transporter CrcB [Bacillus pseudomycoides]PEJ79585.1 fluoride efflux transporter CrcB [Bacillus pseudomycoides]
MKYIAVGIGGIVGALARYELGQWVGIHSVDSFPLATWSANMIGSFLLAFLTMYLFRMKHVSQVIVSSIGTGMIGSFTTFSTVSVETLKFMQHEAFLMAFYYVSTSVVGGLLFSLFGFYLGNALYEKSMKKEGAL